LNDRWSRKKGKKHVLTEFGRLGGDRKGQLSLNGGFALWGGEVLRGGGSFELYSVISIKKGGFTFERLLVDKSDQPMGRPRRGRSTPWLEKERSNKYDY